jgi:signal transduction histidine kinase
VHRLVDLHGGRVTAPQHGPGRGATFTVYLPALTPWRRAGRRLNGSDGLERDTR